MKQRLYTLVFGLLAVLIVAVPVLAQEEGLDHDPRLEGYPGTGAAAVAVSGSTALSWVLLIVLGLVCVGVMFKNARRTHLD